MVTNVFVYNSSEAHMKFLQKHPVRLLKFALPKTADVVIIGGGIIGAACAYYLSAAGLSVHLVERHFPASGTSRACDGLILLWDKSGPELALGQESIRLWGQVEEHLEEDFGFERSGTILLAENGEQLQAGEKRAQALRESGQRAEILPAGRLATLEPEISPHLAGGILFPDDLQVDPRRATLALLAAAKRQGVKLQAESEVIDIQHAPGEGGGVRGVVTSQGVIATPRVVCAAGVWSNHIARMVGIDLPTRPRKGHILVTARRPGFIHHPLLEGGYVTTVESAHDARQVALVAEMTTSGKLLLGSSREFCGYDRTVSLSAIQELATRATRFLPGLESTPIIRSYAGLRPWSPDGLPLIGPTRVPGFYLATGHEGAGICLAPVTGRLVTQMITEEARRPEAEVVAPGRCL
ncbi:MAG: Hydrogen cyanide synthase subunit HcnC [Chloroflexi bacterium]|nr:Hydrogen cyanide synthase subunit HcnC [Chloroflexota bacterium]